MSELAQIALSDDGETPGGLGTLDQDDVDYLFGNAPARKAAARFTKWGPVPAA